MALLVDKIVQKAIHHVHDHYLIAFLFLVSACMVLRVGYAHLLFCLVF